MANASRTGFGLRATMTLGSPLFDATPGAVWILYSDCPEVAGVFPTVITALKPNPVVLAFAIVVSFLCTCHEGPPVRF